MATQVQWRGGTTAEHAGFTGAAREVTVDTQKKTLVVHDGSTAGGEPLLREDQANLPTSVTNGIYVPSANSVALSTNGTKRIEIQADGDIDIDGGGVFYDATNNRLAIGDNGPDSTLTVKAATGVTPFKVSGPSSEFAKIDTSGRLLVGTSSTSTTGTLFVQGNSSASTGPAVVNVSRGNAPSSDGVQLGLLTFSDNNHIGSASIQARRDGGTWTSGTSLPTRLEFSTTADGASSPTEQLRITSDRYVRLASGTGGIQFNGDTAAANALDDYEEGTWTPTLTGVSGGSGQTYTTQSGSYVKIGDLVVLTFSVTLSAKGTMTGNPVIGGIPFAGAGQTGQNAAMNLVFSNLNITPNGVGYTARAGSFAQLYLRKNISGVISLFASGNADFTDTSSITGTISYRVSA